MINTAKPAIACTALVSFSALAAPRISPAQTTLMVWRAHRACKQQPPAQRQFRSRDIGEARTNLLYEDGIEEGQGGGANTKFEAHAAIVGWANGDAQFEGNP